jgi:putative chitinase
MSSFTITSLQSCLPEFIFEQIPVCIEKFEINSPRRMAHFLAQCDYESNGFRVTEESLNYSAANLKKVFKKYFRKNLAEHYAHHPEKIAARLYAGRMGNGNEASKDGALYCGRGVILLRGKANYAVFNNLVEEDLLQQPDLVAQKYALISAAWYWSTLILNTIADQGDDKATVKHITHKMTGSFSQIPNRVQIFNKYYHLL